MARKIGRREILTGGAALMASAAGASAGPRYQPMLDIFNRDTLRDLNPWSDVPQPHHNQVDMSKPGPQSGRVEADEYDQEKILSDKTTRRNASAFKSQRWQDHFENTKNGVILCDTSSFAVHFWSEDRDVYRIFPSSVPMSSELLKTGYTEVVRMAEAPTWRPTPSMRERFPEWPAVVPGNDPLNPLGSHALYLSWQYYRIHGTHDTRKIGRKSSDGCVGLYNDQIAQLYALAKVGTQVRII